MLLLQLLLVLLASKTNKYACIFSFALSWDVDTFIGSAIIPKERFFCEFVQVGFLSLISLNLTLILGHDLSTNSTDNLAFVFGESFGVANIFSSFSL
jgi:hypothetical protein